MAITTESVIAGDELETLLLCSDIITPLTRAPGDASGAHTTWPHNALEQALKLVTAHRCTRHPQSPTSDP